MGIKVKGPSLKFDQVVKLATASGLFMALFGVTDSIVLHNYFTSDYNKFIGSCVYIIVGGWFGVGVMFLVGSVFGKSLEPKFINWKFPKDRVLLYVILAGITGALQTFFYLYSLSRFTPGLVAILMVGSLLGQNVIDVFSRDLAFRLLVVPTSLIITGSIVASISTSHGLSLEAFVVVFLFVNLFDIAATFVRQKTSGLTDSRRNRLIDSINFELWRFLWLAFFGTIFSFGWVIYQNKLDLMKGVFTGGFWGALPFILLGMVCIFCSFVWGYRARQRGSLSQITMLSQTTVVFSFILTYLIIFLFPSAFGSENANSLTIMLNGFGGLFVVAGVILLAQTVPEKNSYVVKGKV